MVICSTDDRNVARRIKWSIISVEVDLKIDAGKKVILD